MTFEEAIREADREWEERVIPDGKEMNWKGHKLRFEFSPSDCVGCFFKDKDECPECDDGAWVEDSPWCTGTPTDRDGIFLIQTKMNNLFLVRWADGFWEDTTGDDCLEDNDILAWQKITPYEEKEK